MPVSELMVRQEMIALNDISKADPSVSCGGESLEMGRR